MPVNNYHILCETGSVGRYCILPGDPGRVAAIASHLERAELVASNREYVTYTGLLEGEKVSVCSTGIGGPSAAIAVEELVSVGADTFIRVGTAGGISMRVKSGELVIPSSAVRQEGTTLHYAPPEFPAASDFGVTTALKAAADALGVTSHVGTVQCKDSFYGQHSPSRMPVSYELEAKWEAWKRLGVLASEMETAALFVVASSLSVRAGAVLSILWNQERKAAGFDEPDEPSSETAIRCAVEAVRLMIRGNA